MKVTVTPMLQSLRDIYAINGVMPRFQAYLDLMRGAKRGEAFPLGVFSPMGKRQAAYLDTLLALDAEIIAQEAACEACARLDFLPDVYRLLLVVADAQGNNWTERHVTDAEWRLHNKYDVLAQTDTLVGCDRWVTVQLWVDKGEGNEDTNAEYIVRETQSAIYRAAHRKHVGIAQTLAEMMQQEGRAMAFAGFVPQLDKEDLAYSREILREYRQSREYPLCFSALYGDAIAKNAGYAPLGLSVWAGFEVGLVEAREEGRLESSLQR